ncbi:hypothetical protein M0R45_017156 [Rubus argutus]|uniref:Uncharacterized protein n=1 Tax=Rubus argutus TaxID=59490 RepID=A0AAW1XUK5_RUBAR
MERWLCDVAGGAAAAALGREEDGKDERKRERGAISGKKGQMSFSQWWAANLLPRIGISSCILRCLCFEINGVTLLLLGLVLPIIPAAGEHDGEHAD